MSILLDQQPKYNSFISAEICNNEDRFLHENKLHYIFVADENTVKHVNNSDINKDDTYDTFIVEDSKIQKKKSNELNIIEKISKKIAQLCNKRNIIIYVLLADSTYKRNDFIPLFNIVLRKDVPDKYYSNIIIFNYINSSNINLSSNIFKFCRYYCLPNVFSNVDNSKKYFRVLNVSCDLALSNIKETYKNNNKLETYNFIHSASLYNYKDLNSLIIERRCSSGKLIQFTGTCWINSILNALLLPKSSRKYMIEQCKINIKNEQIKNKTPLYDIYKLKDELSYEQILTSIIYNIFLKKERPSPLKYDLQNNFILTFANKIKHYVASKYPNDPNFSMTENINFGEGASPFCIISTLRIILSLYLENFQYTYRVFFFKLPPKFNETEIQKMKKTVIKNTVIKKTITKQSAKYNLSACLLSQDSGSHMICGFICDGKEYIYNSNMKQAIECNWSNYDYQNYINYYNEQYQIIDNTIYMEIIIYTLETPDDIEYFEMANNEINKEVEDMVVPDVPCNLKKPLPENVPVPTKCYKPDQELVNGKCLKKCNENQRRNMTTGRCNTISKTIKCYKPDQELVNGKCLKKCNENQTRKIKTGRCVKKQIEKSGQA
jgi:hypothetical protein